MKKDVDENMIFVAYVCVFLLGLGSLCLLFL